MIPACPTIMALGRLVMVSQHVTIPLPQILQLKYSSLNYGSIKKRELEALNSNQSTLMPGFNTSISTLHDF